MIKLFQALVLYFISFESAIFMSDYYSDCDSQYDDNWYDDDLQCCDASERDEVDSQFHSDSDIDSELFEYDNQIDCGSEEVSGHCLENGLDSLCGDDDHRDHDDSGYDLNSQSYNLDYYNSDDENTFDLFSDDGDHFFCPKEQGSIMDTATEHATHELDNDDDSSFDMESIRDNCSQHDKVYDCCDALNEDQLILMSWLDAVDAYGDSLGHKSEVSMYDQFGDHSAQNDSHCLVISEQNCCDYENSVYVIVADDLSADVDGVIDVRANLSSEMMAERDDSSSMISCSDPASHSLCELIHYFQPCFQSDSKQYFKYDVMPPGLKGFQSGWDPPWVDIIGDSRFGFG